MVTVKKTSVTAKKAPVKTAKAAKVPAGLQIPVVGIDGKAKSTMSLPKDLFGIAVNKELIAQAVRVYLANQRFGGASTKTRGEVEGSTRKIYRQKGTGRARHGAIRAPIFVGGGIVFGPKPRDYHLTMPAKMKKKALASAITSQYNAHNIIVIDGLEDLEPKTKNFAKAFSAIGAGKKTLLVLPDKAEQIVRATRNLAHVTTMPFKNLHTYTVLFHDKIVFTKSALSEIQKE